MKAISLLLILCISMSCSVLPATPAGDSTIAITDRQIIESDGSYNGFPSIAKAADGDWILSYRKGSAHVNTPLVILRRSRDSGKTWSPEVAYFDTSQPDPGLALMPDGRLMITFGKLDPDGTSGAAYSLSNDDGLTSGSVHIF